jgi:alpha-glucosidase (family GH31 glycosyl hydrolase)
MKTKSIGLYGLGLRGLGLAGGLLVLSLLAARVGWAQMPMEAYTRHTVDGPAVTVYADTSALRFVAYAPDVLRIDLLPSPSTTFDSSLVVDREAPEQRLLSVDDGAETLTLSTAELTVRIQKTPVRVRVEDASGTVLVEEPQAEGVAVDGATRSVRFRAAPGERFYGTGQRGLGIDLRGERFRSYNRSEFGYDGPVDTMNINVPLLLSSRGYALLFDDPYPGFFDLGASTPSEFVYRADGGELSVYLMAADDAPGLLERYTWLTGRPPMPPKWALGYLQSKYGYRTEDDARAVVRRLREEDIPVDGLILDLYWFNAMGDLSWDRGAFPRPAQMIDDFEAQGVKTIAITEPYVTDESIHFSAFSSTGTPRAGWRQTDAGTEPVLFDNWFSCGNCRALLADFTHPPTRDWWWEQYEDGFLDTGVHGFWTDLGEPELHPASMQHHEGSSASVHNVYNLLWARMVARRVATLRPNRRVVNLTRSGYAGIQRYGVFTWSADVRRSFSGLAVQLPIMLNTTLSGLYYHSSDLGGFVGETSSELYVRWMQMGALTPVMRAHGIDNQPTEPWGFGATALATARDYIELRYRLMPYIYTLAREAHDTGMPLVRPLFFADPDDASLAGVDDAFLLGDDLLVAPVVESGQFEKSVRLPAGTWINYWTDQALRGGQRVTVDAPLGRLPLFVRAGAILPMRATAPDFLGRSVPDTLQLSVYPSEEGGTFSLYEDDGYSRAYREGAFARTTLSQRTVTSGGKSRLQVTVSAADGTFEGQPPSRTYLAAIHRVFTAPDDVRVGDRSVPRRASLDALRRMGEGYVYDDATWQVYVQTTAPVNADRTFTLVGTAPAGPGTATNPPYALEAPRPHPVQQSATLPFSLREPGDVRIVLYDVLGRQVATLVDERRRAGPYALDLSPDLLRRLSSGTYFYRMTADRFGTRAFTATRKMTVVK